MVLTHRMKYASVVHMGARCGVAEGWRHLDSLDAGLDPELLHCSACMGYAVGTGRLRRHPWQRDTVEVEREEQH